MNPFPFLSQHHQKREIKWIENIYKYDKTHIYILRNNVVYIVKLHWKSCMWYFCLISDFIIILKEKVKFCIQESL